MRKRFTMKAFWLVGVLGILTWNLHATPLIGPQRTVAGQGVNLMPLFHWWTNRTGPRPLTAWVHVTGKIVGTNAVGWILAGQAEHTGHSNASESGGGMGPRFVLKTPPVEERAQFEALSAQYKALNEQRAKLAGAETSAKDLDKRIAAEQHINRRYRVRSATLKAEDRQAKATETAAATDVKQLDFQIEALKKKLAIYPSPDHYEVDCFALDTGLEYQRMPVFDHGFSFSRP